MNARQSSPAGSQNAEMAAQLERARRRTLALLDVPTDVQTRQIDPLMSPLVWDLGHVGNYEEQWLLRALDGRAAIDPRLDHLYNAFEHPRRDRPSLPILGPAQARSYNERVREAVLLLLESLDLTPSRDAAAPRSLLDSGFVHRMVIQHEHQHDETLLAAHQLRGEGAEPIVTPLRGTSPPPLRHLPEMVRIPEGEFRMGTSTDPWAYDNERPAHRVWLPDYWLDTTPVTNGAYREFVIAGGYRTESLWSAAGWDWRRQEGLVAPQFWSHDVGTDPCVLRFGRWVPLPLSEPVQHVCWFEAEAFARWAGKRLPSEAEWEKAATSTPDGSARRYPWGDTPPDATLANLGAANDGPVPVGSLPRGANPWGVEQMIGDVWEWTADDFSPYPGFLEYPYKEYSEVFFPSTVGAGRYKVLRGGSWAADPTAVRGTFRNWDLPIRRQIFAGFRCAKDA